MQGILRKMQVSLDDPVVYHLRIGDENIRLNPLLEKKITLTFSGHIFCVQCGRKTAKSFQQGHCYPCYQRLLSCNLCIIHPERCLVEQHSCDRDDWAHAQCDQKHVIYLANSSGLKIGITRNTQIPTRWIDQGAVQAVPLWRVNNRYRAGVVEMACKAFVNDKTNWRAMLKNEVTQLDMAACKQAFLKEVEPVLAETQTDLEVLSDPPITISYPVIRFPQKVISLSFDKTPVIEGTLLGMKGQYLIFNNGVLNIRKFAGYEVRCKLTQTRSPDHSIA